MHVKQDLVQSLVVLVYHVDQVNSHILEAYVKIVPLVIQVLVELHPVFSVLLVKFQCQEGSASTVVKQDKLGLIFSNNAQFVQQIRFHLLVTLHVLGVRKILILQKNLQHVGAPAELVVK